MYVYRIEHQKRKVGPYNGLPFGMLMKFHERYYQTDSCPDPRQEGLGCPRYGQDFCGFKSLSQLTGWFRLRDVFRLRKHGFRVYKFKVRKRVVSIGQKQVLFARHTAFQKEEVRLRALAFHRARSLLPI